MSTIVTDTGFSPDTPADWFEVASDVDPEALLRQIEGVSAIRIRVAAFNDGRAFTLAARLRRAGFTGRLRAAGPMIADQYAMARRSGFDEVEIPDTLAARQPQELWLARADWQGHDYRARLRRRG